MADVVEARGDGVELDDVVVGGAQGRRRRRRGLQRKPHFGEVLDEVEVEPGLAAPSEHVGIEEVPFRTVEDAGADLGLGFDQPLGGERLHCLAKDGAGDAEAGGELHVAGKK